MSSVFSNPIGTAKGEAEAYTRALLELLGDRDPLAVQSVLPDALQEAVAGLTDSQLRQAEKPGKWSVIQVVQHLADTEIVYAYRIRLILASDAPEIHGYDQDAWARRLRYAEMPLADALAQVRILRRRGLDLLRSLRPEEWERAGMHSERGRESVRHITKLLAGHDLLHLRQIARIKSAIGAV
jgi:hypothetical protein